MPEYPAELYARKRIWLLGALRVSDADHTRRLTRTKERALLAYLALYPKPHAREFLAELLWEEGDPARARQNLNKVLFRLNAALGAGWLDSDREYVALRVTPEVWVDVWEFEKISQEHDPAFLQRAVSLYQGDLVPELYDEWLLAPRVDLQEKFFNALYQLGQGAEQAQKFELAAAYYQRLAQSDPLREEAYAGQLRALAQLGKADDALKVYAELERILRAELDAEPSAEVRALAQTLRDAPTQRARVLPAFVGRARERAALLTRLERAADGNGGIVVLLGEAGQGKTRLAEEISQAASWRGWHITRSKGEEYVSPAPLAPLREAVDDALFPARARQLQSFVQAHWLERLAGIFPTLAPAHTFAQTSASHSLQDLAPAFAALLRGLATFAPQLIFLDDMQWADPNVWTLLDALCEACATLPVMFLLCGRLQELRAQPDAWKKITAWDAHDALVLHLEGLDADALQQLARAVSAQTVSAESVRALTQASGGNPLVALALLSQNEALASMKSASHSQSLYSIYAAQLARLTNDARHALAAAATLGFSFSYNAWEHVSAFALPRALALAASELERVGLLHLDRDGYHFDHDTLREFVYNALEKSQRRDLHTRALAALRDAATPLTLLFHAEQAQDTRALGQFALAAGEQFFSSFSYAQAARYFQLAQEHSAENVAQKYKATRGRVRALHRLGERAAEWAALEQLEKLNEGMDVRRAQTAWEFAEYFWETEGKVQAERWTLETWERAHAADDQRLAAMAAERMVLYFLGQEQYAQAYVWLARADQLYRALNDVRGEAMVLQLEGSIAAHEGYWKKTLAALERALPIARAVHDHALELRILSVTARALEVLGRLPQAYETFTRVKNYQAELNQVVAVAQCDLYLAALEMEFGSFENARAHLQDVLAASQRLEFHWGVAFGFLLLGILEMEEGAYENAARAFEQGKNAAHRAGSVRMKVSMQLERARLARWRGAYTDATQRLETLRAQLYAEHVPALALDLEMERARVYAALKQPARAHEIFQDLPRRFPAELQTLLLEMTWHMTKYCVCQAEQDKRGARHALTRAHRALMEMAEHFSGETRTQFLNGRRHYREVMEAWDAECVFMTRRVKHNAGGETDARFTLAAPDDDVLDAEPRRKQILTRLLQQAQTQNVHIPDEMLAEWLGVSRRTILRDKRSIQMDSNAK